MQSLKRYMQQFAPSGNVGAVRADPGLADTGAELPWRGVEAAAQGVDQFGQAMQKVQDSLDESELISAERQAGEYMAKVWNDIENEPDYTKHENLYSNGYFAAQKFTPKSPSAARIFRERMEQYKPVWDRQYYAMTTRRKLNTLDADTQANWELDAQRFLKAIEKGDPIEVELSRWALQNTSRIRIENGLSTRAQADANESNLAETGRTTAVWADAMDILTSGDLAGAEAHVMESNLTNQQKDSILYKLRFHYSNIQGQAKQETALIQERARQAIVKAIEQGRYSEIPALIDSSPLSADDKYDWQTRAYAREKEFSRTGKDLWKESDPDLYFRYWRAIDNNDPMVTEPVLAGKVGAGLSVADYQELAGMLKKTKPAEKSSSDVLFSTYLDQIDALAADVGGEAGFLSEQIYKGSNWKEYSDYGKAGPKVLGADLRRVFIRWRQANLTATPDEMDLAYQSLLGAVQKRTIPAFLDHIRARESTLIQEAQARAQKAALPLTAETAPMPKTRQEFLDTLKRMTDRTEFDKYYERYSQSWKQK